MECLESCSDCRWRKVIRSPLGNFWLGMWGSLCNLSSRGWCVYFEGSNSQRQDSLFPSILLLKVRLTLLCSSERVLSITLSGVLWANSPVVLAAPKGSLLWAVCSDISHPLGAFTQPSWHCISGSGVLGCPSCLLSLFSSLLFFFVSSFFFPVFS